MTTIDGWSPLTAPSSRLVFPERVGQTVCIKVPDDHDRLIPVELTKLKNGRLKLNFSYNMFLKDEIKLSLSDARWNPTEKHWHVKDDTRTRFVFEYLCYGEPADVYNRELTKCRPTRSLYEHQIRLFNHAITCRRVYWQAEMGVGKTLTSIELLEWIKENIYFGSKDERGVPLKDDERFWISAPPNVIQSWTRELTKWESTVKPKLISMYSIRKAIDNVKTVRDKKVFPSVLIIDESSKIKNERAQISINHKYLSECMEACWGYGTYVVTMTGSPDPKEPTDVYSQAEVARPGYLKEKNSMKFQQTLAMMEKCDGPTGSYHRIIGFKDGTCAECNNKKEDHINSGGKIRCIYVPKTLCATCEKYHSIKWSCREFKASGPEVDEVKRMGERLAGLTICIRKADCLDLPQKVYQTIECAPSPEMLKAAELVQAQETSTVGMLGRLRQFSDGFLYREKGAGEKIYEEIPKNPKRKALGDLLDQYSDVNESRFIIYAGFKASIDICVDEAVKRGWHVIRADSRGYKVFLHEPAHIEPTDKFFCEAPKELKICYIAHPGTAGHGKNLQVAKAICYYSNDFNFENRIQSEDRAHRMGMRESLTIYDLFCLATDRYVRDNLLAKENMQDMAMNHVRDFSLRRSR